MMKLKYARVLGVDIARDKIDVNDSADKVNRSVSNTAAAIRKQLIAKITDPQHTLVVCEATGGYEHALVEALHEAGIPVAVANPRQVRDFARGHGYLEKSDSIDARMIRRFGEDVELHPTRQRSEAEKQLQVLVRRRLQLLGMINEERNRLAQTHDEFSRKMIKTILGHLRTQFKQIDCLVKKCLAEQAKTDPKVEILVSTPGVGIVTAATLLAELPELGRVNRSEIAKLAGVAPIINQSGKSDKKRRARGGRSQVRTGIYMATLVATRHNPVIKRFYQRLIARGKLPMVAMVAAMRKLLTILNDMVRNGETWRPAKVSISQ